MKGPLDPRGLEPVIGYRFRDADLLARALTHVSATAERVASNQRLEFLGDRVLGLAVSDMIYGLFPQATEGDLSRRLASLVRRETCADVAGDWGVSDYVKLGEGEAQSGGARKEAILADICEAIIGAVFLDGGYEAARLLVRRAFEPRIDRAVKVRRDSKSALQEWAQARGLPPPRYDVAARKGPDHEPFFTIAVSVEGFAPVTGEGPSKRFGEQAAAEAFLRAEKIIGGGA